MQEEHMNSCLLYTSIPNNLMPYISQVAVGKREKLGVFGNDYDTPVSYTHLPIRAWSHCLPVQRQAMITVWW